MELIAAGKAETVQVDGGDMYRAWRLYGMLPIASESYEEGGPEGAEYYAVGIVNKVRRV